MLANYIDYLKDNPEHYWFKRKLYGWGWVPVTWQGWLTILIFIGLLLLISTWNFESRSEIPTSFLLEVAVLVSVFIAICYKTGGKPRWQWGLPKEDINQKN